MVNDRWNLYVVATDLDKNIRSSHNYSNPRTEYLLCLCKILLSNSISGYSKTENKKLSVDRAPTHSSWVSRSITTLVSICEIQDKTQYPTGTFVIHF